MAKVNLAEIIGRLPPDEQERIRELSARINAERRHFAGAQSGAVGDR